MSCHDGFVLAEFWADVKKAVGAWRAAPLLPIFSLALYLPFSLQQVHVLFALVGFLTMIFYVGYVGTERLWYATVWKGGAFSARDVWSVSWAYWRRYFGLAVVAMVATTGLLLAGALLTAPLSADPQLVRAIGFLLIGVLGDVWLTFMTPALAYSAETTGDGIKIGWRFLKDQGRRAALYALAPPLVAAALLQRTPPESLGTGPRVALTVTASLVLLALKGATAAKYLRHHAITAPPASDVMTRKVTGAA